MAKKKKCYYLLPMDYLKKLGRVPIIGTEDKNGVYYPNGLLMQVEANGGKRVNVEKVRGIDGGVLPMYKSYLSITINYCRWTVPRNWLIYR